MYKITWDSETGGILLNLKVVENTLSVAPRPVFWEELDLLGLDKQDWKYPHCDEPLMWACNKQYFTDYLNAIAGFLAVHDPCYGYRIKHESQD